MKKKFVFVSDFDGTISYKDFYWLIIDKYLKEKGIELFNEWKLGKFKDIEFLSYIFNNIGRTEEEIDDDIFSIPLDENIKDFIEYIQKNNGDFIILSAGTDYYINKILEKNDINGVTVYSNKGIFRDNGIYLDVDKSSSFYSDRYGIDKKSVIEYLKTKYEVVFFAGDSEPDVNPASISDFIFSKPTLSPLLREKNISSFEFTNFKQVKNKLIEKGVF